MATSLELAITAIRSGRKEEGRQLLNLLIQQNPNNEQAWLWMSSVVNTDEQRARCLYHVLAINPDNELARRGLQILGIVVSDSRPVKVPRDSQPIPVQRPEPEVTTPWPVPQAAPAPTPSPTDTQPLPQPAEPPKAEPTPAPITASEERRPFRLDPKTITQELPFVPLREPFAEPARRSPSAFIPREEADQPAAAETPQPNGLSAPAAETAAPVQAKPESALVPFSPPDVPLPDFPPVASAPPPQPSAAPTPVSDTGPLANSTPAQPQAQNFGPGGQINETRPSQPIWVPHSNVTMSMPAPQNPLPYPGPNLNSNMTMGMPTQYLPPQNPIQAVPPIHSNATMGMPMPPQNGLYSHQTEMMPVIQPNGTVGMIPYQPTPFQPPYPQNQIYHSSSTMAMPTMTEAEARARLMTNQAMPVHDPYAALRMAAPPPQAPPVAKKSSKKAAKNNEDEGEEEVNLMAVIVFGSLSVTALGGMGMLILLWFTSV